MNSFTKLNNALLEHGWSIWALEYYDGYYLRHEDCDQPVGHIDGLFLATRPVHEIIDKIESTMKEHRCWLDLMFEFNGATLGWMFA